MNSGTGFSLFRRPFSCIVLCSTLLSACATMDADQCKVADWRLIGYQDGVAGKSASVIGTYREDCAEHAVVPDLDAYTAGRSEGLNEYCRESNAFRLGQSGRAYNGVCPLYLEEAFQAAYTEGREIYLARSAVTKTQNQIRSHDNRISTLEDEKKHKLSHLVAPGLSADQRVLLLYEIKEIDDEIDDLHEQIAVLEYELHDQQLYLDQVRQVTASY